MITHEQKAKRFAEKIFPNSYNVYDTWRGRGGL